jgi:hypothetical protein
MDLLLMIVVNVVIAHEEKHALNRLKFLGYSGKSTIWEAPPPVHQPVCSGGPYTMYNSAAFVYFYM